MFALNHILPAYEYVIGMKWNLYVEFPILAIINLLIKGGGRGEVERAEGIQFLNSYVAYL